MSTRYLDNCDRCLTESSIPIAPTSVAPDGNGGVLATYKCPTCTAIWTCGWSAQSDDGEAA
ncbi:hypothetical protein SMD44_00981 [Streptomyces alboflavus]|uniref:Uncharacterized protein n=1 Tax=Streptomyces alboflavus TaxID=67267 RepID=A0A1Z1W560_9ACTN|nr:hypothetical protein [Streptomyces alboflavus]ARX81583.1 hypothetical protein SMD44_00981 [Streptomyces alboflavus]